MASTSESCEGKIPTHSWRKSTLLIFFSRLSLVAHNRSKPRILVSRKCHITRDLHFFDMGQHHNDISHAFCRVMRTSWHSSQPPISSLSPLSYLLESEDPVVQWFALCGSGRVGRFLVVIVSSWHKTKHELLVGVVYHANYLLHRADYTCQCTRRVRKKNSEEKKKTWWGMNPGERVLAG